MMMTIDYKDDDDECSIEHYGDVDVDDDIYIMVKCLCVCNENAYFRIQKIWSFLMFIATFHTQRNWPFLLFPGTFRTQRIWSFPCFLRLLCSKDLVISHVYRHFPNSKVSGNSKTIKSFDFFKGFLLFPDIKSRNRLKDWTLTKYY